MARSSTIDPVEKFRFRVTVVAVDASLTGAVDTLAGLTGQNSSVAKYIGVLSRFGFSEVSLPKVTISEISYRENIDNPRFIKVPGLTKYEPVTLRRGVTNNRDMYDWFRLVNEELALLSVAGELSRDAQFSPTQSDIFRKDVVIEVLDREGKSVKGWYLFNAWPSSYVPGNDLNASSEEKLVEEMTLTYEFFIEMEGGFEGFAKEIAKGAFTLAAGAALNRLGNGAFGGGSGFGI